MHTRLRALAWPQPLHWIYDINVINDLLAKEGRTAANPEFYPTPSCPFYNKDGQKVGDDVYA